MSQINNEMLKAIQDRNIWHKSNTTVVWYDNGICNVFLYNTCIATIKPISETPDYSVSINTFGYRKKPTLERINAILSVAVNEPKLFSKRGELFVDYTLKGEKAEFTDGMVFDLKYGAIQPGE